MHTLVYLALGALLLIGCPLVVLVLRRRKSEWTGLAAAFCVALLLMATVLLWNGVNEVWPG
jgi:drug/metabolite transporter superfamily protein YnfA